MSHFRQAPEMADPLSGVSDHAGPQHLLHLPARPARQQVALQQGEGSEGEPVQHGGPLHQEHIHRLQHSVEGQARAQHLPPGGGVVIGRLAGTGDNFYGDKLAGWQALERPWQGVGGEGVGG